MNEIAPHLPVNPSIHTGTFTMEQALERDRLKRLAEEATERAGSPAAIALEEARLRSEEAQQIEQEAAREFEALIGRRESLVQAIGDAKRILEWAETNLGDDPRKSLEEALGAAEGYHPWEDPVARIKIANYISELSGYEGRCVYFGALKQRWTPRLAELESDLAEVEKELSPTNKGKKLTK